MQASKPRLSTPKLYPEGTNVWITGRGEAYIYICTYICIYIYIYMHVYVCVYTCYLHLYMYIYIYIHIIAHCSSHEAISFTLRSFGQDSVFGKQILCVI